MSSADRLPEDARAIRAVESALVGALRERGFEEVIVPLVEEEDTYLSEAEVRLVRDGAVVGLRAGFTGPVARIVSTRMAGEVGPVRLCYRGVVFREGRQCRQAGGEVFGVPGEAGDVEALRVGLEALDAAGIVGSRAVVGSVAAIEARTPGVLGDPSVRSALDRRDAAALRGWPALAQLLRNPPVLPELVSLRDGLGTLGARTILDPAHVRGFAYYTGIVFDFYAPGFARAVGGGGRYDTLCARWGAERPAVGFSFDVDLLARGPTREAS